MLKSDDERNMAAPVLTLQSHKMGEKCSVISKWIKETDNSFCDRQIESILMLRPEWVGLSRILLLTSRVSWYTRHQAIMYAEAHINPYIVYFNNIYLKAKHNTPKSLTLFRIIYLFKNVPEFKCPLEFDGLQCWIQHWDLIGQAQRISPRIIIWRAQREIEGMLFT